MPHEHPRELIPNRRYAEAYDLLYLLIEDIGDTSACARELTWICEHWGPRRRSRAVAEHDPTPVWQLKLFE